MAIVNPNILKGWFVTLAKPLQDQFWDWIDSFRHKNDKIGIDDLTNELQQTIESIPAFSSVIIPAPGTLSIVIPAGTLIDKIDIYENAIITFKIGTTPGGQQLLSPEELEAGGGIINKDLRFTTDTTIYFGGITNDTIIKLYKR